MGIVPVSTLYILFLIAIAGCTNAFCVDCSLERLRRKSLPAASQLRFKCARRDVTINELTADRLFEPSCSIDDPTQFSIVQKHSTCGVYWCSTASGFAIEDTLSWHKKPDCSM